MRVLLALPFLLFALHAQAQQITGPTTAGVGELVVLETSGATNLSWLAASVNGIESTTDRKKFLVLDGGTKLVFAASQTGEVVFVLVSSDASLQVTTAQHRIKIGTGPSPVPNPNPNPNPGPTPNVPDGEFGLTKLAHGLASKLTVGRSRAASVAANYEAVAAQLVAGGYPSIGIANQDLQARNQESTAADRTVWLDTFFAPIADEMLKLQQAGKLTSMQDVGKAYRATADGLKLVK
jgi:hypothetical protein